MSNSGDSEVKVVIKFGGESIPISISPHSTISHLKSLLQTSTNVLPRGQKLIHKGNLLVDSNTLTSSHITNGSKIMLMASQGLHQGEGPTVKDAPILSNYRRVMNADSKPQNLPPPAVVGGANTTTTTRSHRWNITGVIPLSHSRLKAIPDDVWDCGSSARVLDLSNNHISDVPIKIGHLRSIQKLILNTNQITDNSISWQALIELRALSYLSLNQNHLTNLPSSLCSLTTLEQLHVAGNKLRSIPVEMGCLTRLEVLKVNNNRINAIPASIGDCSSLIEVDLSSNLLVELPETFGSRNLKVLHLNNNGLKSLPSTLFKKCPMLSTLDLHGTEITMAILRQAEGWEEFDERRRLKYQKQLDFRAGGSAEFDEGADKN